MELLNVMKICFDFFVLYACVSGQFQQRNLSIDKTPRNITNLRNSSVLVTSYDLGILQCALKCAFNRLCSSLLYNLERKQCKLLTNYMDETSNIGNNTQTLWQYLFNPSVCSDGWSPFAGHCYIFNETSLIWNTANDECKRNGAYLLEIETQYENDWIITSLLFSLCSVTWDINCEVFVGGSTEKGVFKWECSNNLLTYQNWYPNEPSDIGTRECIFLMPNGQWSDGNCEYPRKFICEKKQIT